MTSLQRQTIVLRPLPFSVHVLAVAYVLEVGSLRKDLSPHVGTWAVSQVDAGHADADRETGSLCDCPICGCA